MRRARTKALVRPCPRPWMRIFEIQERGGKGRPEQVTELQDARKGLRGGAALRPSRRRSRLQEEPGARLGSGHRPDQSRRAPPSSSKPSCAPIRRFVLIASWRVGRGWTAPASISTRRATYPATGQRDLRWATWRRALNAIRSLNPSLKAASETSAFRSSQAADSGLELAFTHGIDLGRGRGIGL